MNHLQLTAHVAEVKPLRFTPAGLPALDLKLEHESTVLEAHQQRQVKCVLRALAIGAVAESLAQQALGSCWEFSGFLASLRQTKSVVFHIQEFQQSHISGGPDHGHV